MRLADPPLWEYLLLEQPWPAVVALGAAAVVLTVLAQRRNSRRMRVVAWGLAVAAGAVYALAWQVTTERQQLLRATEALVAATEAPMDVEGFTETWLGANAVLIGPEGTPWLDREQLEEQLRGLGRRDPIERHTLRRLDAEITRAGVGRSVIELSTQARGGTRGFGPLRTEWDLRWQRDDQDQWRVQEIHWVSFRSRPAEERLLRW